MEPKRDRLAVSIRQWDVLRKLTSRSHTPSSMAKELGISGRTVRRYLVAIEAIGFPLIKTCLDEKNGLEITYSLPIRTRRLVTALLKEVGLEAKDNAPICGHDTLNDGPVKSCKGCKAVLIDLAEEVIEDHLSGRL